MIAEEKGMSRLSKDQIRLVDGYIHEGNSSQQKRRVGRILSPVLRAKDEAIM